MASKTQQALKCDVFRPREWGAPSKARKMMQPWYGLDTERDAQTGEFVCGYAVGEETVRFKNFKDLPQGTYWVWNLPYDIEGMVRDLGHDDGWCMKADGAPFVLDGAKCVYFHGKRFDWADEGGRRIFLEASSFFGRMALKTAAAKIIGDAKDPVDASKMSLERYQRDKGYQEIVDEYCQKDARLVYDIVRVLDEGVETAGKLLGVGTTLGATPGATARKFLSGVGQFPQILWQTQRAFLQSYCGGRFEITKRGVMEEVYQYDLVSAYPWALTQCPFLTESARHRTTRRLSPDALYGSYKVRFDMGDEYLGIAPAWKGSTRVYSAAEKQAWLSKPEVDWLHMNGHDYTILEGIEVFDSRATNKWAEIVHGLFKLKQEGKGHPEGMGAKIVLNSLYGILIQLVPRSGKWVPIVEAENPVDFCGDWALEQGPKAFSGGKYYAPLYASHLTALTRVKLLDAALSVGDAYIGGHTDSVLTTEPLQIPTGRELGDWDLEKKARELIITKTGVYAMDEKVKSRGIDRNTPKEALWAPTQSRKTRTGVKTAKEWSEVSVIHTKQIANNLDIESKRIWDREFSKAVIDRREYVDSRPLKWVGA